MPIRYTEQESEIIRDNYQTLKYKDLAKMVNKACGNNRDSHSVKNRMYKLGIGKWSANTSKYTDEQIAYIDKTSQSHNLKETVALFNVTFNAQRSEKSIVRKLAQIRYESKANKLPAPRGNPLVFERAGISKSKLIMAMGLAEYSTAMLASELKLGKDYVQTMISFSGVPESYSCRTRKILGMKAA